MILYFSGTGNSEYVARFLSQNLDEPVAKIATADPSKLIYQGDSLGIVCPVYSWGIPPIVTNFMLSLNQQFLKESFLRPVWLVLTCGDETGLAPCMFEKTLKNIGLTLSGGWSVIMPNVYVLLPGFDVDKRAVETKKLSDAPKRLLQIVAQIKDKNWEKDYIIGPWPKLKSKVIFPLFKKWGIFPKKWHWSKECISCGKCVAACPVKNISFINRHPRWGNNCTSCLACYHSCPVHAVEYGRITTHKGQYHCPF